MNRHKTLAKVLTLRKGDQLIVVILLLYLGLGTAYSLVVPAFEAPDEPAHFDYVRYLNLNRRLPVQQPDPDQSSTLEAHQPPLYYLLGAVLTAWIDQADFEPAPPNPCVQWSPDLPGQRYVRLHGDGERYPYRSGWLVLHLLRGFSLLLGGITVWATYELGGLIWPHQQGLALAAATAVALTPQFLFIHASVNNDNLATALAALVLLASARAIESAPDLKRPVLLGLLLGLGALTKYSVLALTPVALVGALVPPLQKRRPRQALLHLALLVLIPALIAGWWYLRNQRLYDDPWAWQVALASHPHDVRTTPLTWADLQLFVARVFASFWGYFGWLTVRLSSGVYIALALTTAVGIAGAAAGLLRSQEQRRLPLLIALLTVASVAASLSRYILTYNHTAYQGRFLFAAMPAVAVLLVFGWGSIVGERSQRWLAAPVIAAGLTLNLMAVRAILLAYPSPDIYQRASLAEWPQPCVVLDERLQLLAYKVTRPSVRSGEELALIFHWFGLAAGPSEGRLEIELLGRNDHLLGHATVIPTWQANRTTRDAVHLTVTDTPQPTQGHLRIRLLDDAGNARPVLTRNRHPVGDAFELLPVKVAPAEPTRYTFQRAVNARLGEVITLLGFDLSTTRTAPGETLRLTLYWQVEASPGADYAVFVHLMDEAGQPLAQADGPPDGGSYPVTMWEAGEQIRDERLLVIDNNVPPGLYRLGVGFYHPTTGERLPALDAQGNRLPSDTIVLAQVLVGEP